MKISVLVFLAIFTFNSNLHGQTEEPFTVPPFPGSIKLVFHNIGWNALHSFTYNYGANFALAGLVTYASIQSGFDLYWRNLAYDNTFLEQAGIPAVYIGVAVPIILPAAVYLAGLTQKDNKMQLLGLALTQSLALTTPIQAGFKMITGRAEPGISDVAWHDRGTRDENNSGKFDWFNMEMMKGWPSGHVAHAFSAAAIISELYKDNLWLKIGVYSYAVVMGVLVSFNVHWASEIFAGALVGYAMGKTIGRSFNQLLGDNESRNNFSVLVGPNKTGFTVQMAVGM